MTGNAEGLLRGDDGTDGPEGFIPPPEGIDLQLECADADRDGYGVGKDCLGLDCDDADPAIRMSASTACYTGPSAHEGVGVCTSGIRHCVFGRWLEECVGEVHPSVELCDGRDNNCNGALDETVVRFSQSGEQQPFELVYRPVDVVFVVDNSGSMSEEIASIERNIDDHFARLIGGSGLDYRVILLSRHGAKASTGGWPICVGAPLSGNDCTQPAACPVNGPRFFHYSADIGSLSSLAQVLSTFSAADGCGLAPGGWSQWLRADALKVFIEITDHGPNSGGGTNGMTAQQFETALLSLPGGHFGTASNRNYVFHTIAGLRENTPSDAPWLATDPLVSQLCTGNGGKVNSAGTEYQRLSRWTGGLRFPVCEYQSFDAVFQTVAAGVIERSQMSCAFKAPAPPPGSGLASASLEFIPTNGGATLALPQVADEAACANASGSDAFYVMGDGIHLCPGACERWREDPSALLDVLYACGIPRGP